MKKDLIATVAKRARFTQQDTKVILDTFVEVLQDFCNELKDKEGFTISEFAKITCGVRKERQIKNPKTGEMNTIHEARRIRIKPTSAFLLKATGAGKGGSWRKKDEV